MGLRLAEGVDLARIAAISGIAQSALINARGVDRLAQLGMVAIDGNRLTVLPQGMLLLDAILPEVVAIS
jgi:coproporphyrinogen III oxidase-like Fe-S oxidoreductase